MVFRGEYQHNMDVKGRVAIPVKYREGLGEKFYMTKGLDNCVYMLSEEQYDLMIENFDLNNVKERKVHRFFFGSTVEGETDKQGRVMVPQSLRQYAKLEKEVVFAGIGNKVEIWNAQDWNEYNSDDSDIIAGLMEEIGR